MFFYAYLHLDPRTNAVRYVGAGPRSRGYDWNGRGREHAAWIAELDAYDLEPVVSFPFCSRDRREALWAEQELIKWHLAYGSALFNLMGVVKMTEATKQKLKLAKQAKWLFDPDFRARQLVHMETARKALAERNRSASHRARITKHQTVTGRPCGKCGGTLRYGKSRNCVSCAKINN